MKTTQRKGDSDMKKWMAVACVALSGFFAGCGGSEPAEAPAGGDEGSPTINLENLDNAPAPEAPAAPEAPVAAPEVAPAPEPAPAPEAPVMDGAAAPAAAPAVPGEVDPQLAKLIGTTWMIDDIEANFKDATTVALKGGPLAAIMPNGLDATYTYENGTITVSAVGSTKTGTWDGTTLVIDGKTATKK